MRRRTEMPLISAGELAAVRRGVYAMRAGADANDPDAMAALAVVEQLPEPFCAVTRARKGPWSTDSLRAAFTRVVIMIMALPPGKVELS